MNILTRDFYIHVKINTYKLGGDYYGANEDIVFNNEILVRKICFNLIYE